jgi:uncharacterized protein
VSTAFFERELPRERARVQALAAGSARHAAHGGGAFRGPEDVVLCGCLTAMMERYHASESWLAEQRVPLPGSDELEGERVAEGLPPVVDGHVHVFPDPVFDALWRWFEAHAWPIRYKLRAPETVRFLLDRGVSRVVALHYAHKPGMSRALNHFAARLAEHEPRMLAFGTVLPGEPDAADVLREAKALGLVGVKLHCHVQGFAPDSDAAMEVFRACDALELPVLIHAGREPKSTAYRIDPYEVCAAPRVERVLEAFPKLRLCVPHFGADEYDAYAALLLRHENLYLDTTMVVGGMFPGVSLDMLRVRPDRIFYGTDFPNLPYAWDRELKCLAALELGAEDRALMLGRNALAFVGVAPR